MQHEVAVMQLAVISPLMGASISRRTSSSSWLCPSAHPSFTQATSGIMLTAALPIYRLKLRGPLWFPFPIELKGNPAHEKDWWETTLKSTGDKVRYTVAHYAVTEARFRQHVRKVDAAKAESMIALDDILALLTQDDVMHRRVFDPESPVYVPDFGVWIKAENNEGKAGLYALSRQMVLLCVERRKAWRLLQSKAGIDSKDYRAQKALLAKLAAGELKRDDFLAGGAEMLKAEVAKLTA